ncbi:MAG: thermonuclease family protein [Oceanibaculum nanhaiense]|jgi:micrococcal nuclease|uniref:thermonuclease family protein n=1 Tax=Oceanibaculum nanhaiense TaxID=1909734 RepID=UPI0032EC70D8
MHTIRLTLSFAALSLLCASLFAPAVGASDLAARDPGVRAPAAIAGPVEASFIGNYDGDTITVRAWIWPRQSVETSVRLAGIDAPELRGRCEAEKQAAQAARDRLNSLLSQASRIELHDIELDKYGGRVLARVVADGQDMAAAMAGEGHARPYAGDTRKGWCD